MNVKSIKSSMLLSGGTFDISGARIETIRGAGYRLRD